MYDYRRGGSVFGAFLLGGFVGAVLGLLFAPRSGKETRELIAGKAEEYWGEGVEMYEAGREKVIEVYSTGKEKVAESSEQLRSKIEEARERLQEQVAKSAEAGREKISEAVPAVKEVLDKAAGAAKSGVDVAGARAADTLDFVAKKAHGSEPPAGTAEAGGLLDDPTEAPQGA